MVNIYRPGDHYVICDECGFKVRVSEVRKRWDGFMVCRKDYETRHPQDNVRGRRDRIAAPISRPEPADSFLEDNDVSGDDL